MDIIKFDTKNNTNVSSLATRGIYFLFNENKIVYVGQSNGNILHRIVSHMDTKVFDSFNTISCSYEDLSILEAEYILRIKPAYNKNIPSNNKWVSKNIAKKEYGMSKHIFNKLNKNNYFSEVLNFVDLYVKRSEIEAYYGR